ncbi:MAG TPA: YbaB/EbfC family nucleoid-associated protein [Pseudonocardiaceae bacterium]|jgi:DNA-binding protein YbaB|nr:YbaB/EbfC family nucleoid-associated protein [Pseudonocardiaceae bacterium]
MTSGHVERAEQLMAKYAQVREQTRELQRRMAEISCTATSPRRVVSVTVGRQGEVTAMKFPTSAYKRMTPIELAAVIMETLGEAREQALNESAQLMAPMLPAGLDAQAMVRGTVDFDKMLPADPRSRTSLLSQE